jgi:predicted PurR-regulated permease PerM
MDEETVPFRRRLRAAETALIVLAVLAVIAAAKLTAAFLVPVVTGMLLSYALKPVVTALERVHVHRAIGAAIVLAVAIGAVAGTAFLLRQDAAALVAELPQAARKLRETTQQQRGAPGPIAHVREAAAELNKAAAAATGAPASPARVVATADSGGLQGWVAEQSAKVLTVMGELGIAALLAYFLLASGDAFRRKVVHIAGPTLAKRRITVEILDDIHVQVQRYLLILLSTNILIALSIWGILVAFHIERAALWAAVAGVLHVIPYAGTAITTVLIAAAAFLQTTSVGHAALVAGCVLAASSAIGMGLVPWLQGRAASMNAAAVFISLLFFGWLWGGWGLLLGAPLVAVLKTVADRVPRMEPLGALLGAAVAGPVVPPTPQATAAKAELEERAQRAPEAAAGSGANAVVDGVQDADGRRLA